MVVAPGSHSPEDNLMKGAEALREWGFDVSYDQKLQNPQIFLSNTDAERWRTLKAALLNPKISAIWCLRGGYGANRLLPYLDQLKKPQNKKLLIGLSDVSSLHIYLNKKWNWPTLHASLLDRLALKKLSVQNETELQSCLFDPNYITEFKNLQPLNKAAGISKKTIKSSVTGGNLMVVTSSLGTPYQINAQGKILFFEEIAERAYRIDRCLQQMKQADVFKKARAVVFGDFTNCDEPDNSNYVDVTLRRFCEQLSIPAFKGIETGHGELQRPLFFNTETHLTCGPSPQMLVCSAFKK